MEQDYREPYPAWVLYGMDVLAAGILIASFRDAWAVVRSLGAETSSMLNNVVAAAVVLAIDASILLFEQARSQIKLRGGNTRMCDLWVSALIVMSAILNVRYLTQTGNLVDQVIAAILGVAIPSTIAVLGYIKGDMLAFNAFRRRPPTEQSMTATLPFASPFAMQATVLSLEPADEERVGSVGSPSPKFRLGARRTASAAATP